MATKKIQSINFQVGANNHILDLSPITANANAILIKNWQYVGAYNNDNYSILDTIDYTLYMDDLWEVRMEFCQFLHPGSTINDGLMYNYTRGTPFAENLSFSVIGVSNIIMKSAELGKSDNPRIITMAPYTTKYYLECDKFNDEMMNKGGFPYNETLMRARLAIILSGNDVYFRQDDDNGNELIYYPYNTGYTSYLEEYFIRIFIRGTNGMN
jgi:hypothetical protein